MSERLLRHRDYTFIIVRDPASWSPDHPDFGPWREVQAAIIDIGKICDAYERDGINVYFASKPFQKTICTDVKALAQAFQLSNPPQTRDLRASLRDAINYFVSRRGKRLGSNGELILVLLDETPEDQEGVIKELVYATRMMDQRPEHVANYELGVCFILVGLDPQAEAFLQFLDDNLENRGARHDIVDTRSWRDLRSKPIKQLLIDALMD